MRRRRQLDDAQIVPAGYLAQQLVDAPHHGDAHGVVGLRTVEDDPGDGADFLVADVLHETHSVTLAHEIHGVNLDVGCGFASWTVLVFRWAAAFRWAAGSSREGGGGIRPSAGRSWGRPR